jgi:predicted MPP superfamily phosphohydrolase
MKNFEVNIYKPAMPNLPDAFEGYKIAVIADLHDWDYGGRLELALQQVRPDMIAWVGDIVQNKFEGHRSAILMSRCIEIAPCYYVSGNHEARINRLDDILQSMTDMGCTVLEDKWTTVTRGNDKLVVLGLKDVQLYRHLNVLDKYGNRMDKKTLYKHRLRELVKETIDIVPHSFRILLAHRPEFFDWYAQQGIDLTISGHVHGGQIRLFGKALFGINQGFFPKYDAGLKTKSGRHLMVSRGLGHTRYTLCRINNMPELAIVQLTKHS